MIRTVEYSDASRLAEIYNHYVANSTATFEIDPISSDEMKNRIKDIERHSLPWLVCEDDSTNTIGYAYASKWKERAAYRQSVEITVYLDHNLTAQGLGSKLYTALFADLKNLSIHAAIGGISLPNEASVALHEKFGMNKAAHFPEIGLKWSSTDKI